MNEHKSTHIHIHDDVRGRRGWSPDEPRRRPGRGPRGRGPGGGPRGGGRGRMRRGDVRSALLIALLDGPGHGYELIQNLDARTGGAWKPSPGSVYPTLQLLDDEGLVTAQESDGKRVYAITDAGRAAAEQRIETEGFPWDAIDGGDAAGALRTASRSLHGAARQVATTGSPEVIATATEILTEARRQIYRLLAED